MTLKAIVRRMHEGPRGLVAAALVLQAASAAASLLPDGWAWINLGGLLVAPLLVAGLVGPRRGILSGLERLRGRVLAVLTLSVIHLVVVMGALLALGFAWWVVGRATGDVVHSPGGEATTALAGLVVVSAIAGRLLLALPILLVEGRGPIFALIESWDATDGRTMPFGAIVALTFLPAILLRLVVAESTAIVVAAPFLVLLAATSVVLHDELAIGQAEVQPTTQTVGAQPA